MLFNSLDFVLFFTLVLCVYHALPHKLQNRFLLAASYFFYGCWDIRFLALILYSTILDFRCASRIHASPSTRVRKAYLLVSVVGNLGILATFKYLEFFRPGLQALLAPLGLTLRPWTHDIVVPVGISFYTFQTMSYTLDVYRRELKPTRNFFDFALFVSFFPQLLAGPIERGSRLLPQIVARRQPTTDGILAGLHLIAWGYYQKVFIADNLALIVDHAFAETSGIRGGEVLFAACAFHFQIFCDFAGYSNIARGCARLLGFELSVNFRAPHFSASPREIWRRWHITIVDWFRDYVYLPLGGKSRGPLISYRNTLITILLLGIWHGASWNFVLFGLFMGILQVVYEWIGPRIPVRWSPTSTGWNQVLRTVRVLVFLQFWLLAAVIFRSTDLDQIRTLFVALGTSAELGLYGTAVQVLRLLTFTWLLLWVEILHWRRGSLDRVFAGHWPWRLAGALVIFYSVTLWSEYGARPFEYFQF